MPIIDEYELPSKKSDPGSKFGEVLQGIWLEDEICFAIAGGGCKAFYGLGFGHELKTWGLKLRQVSGVSAGAAMVLSLLCETEEESVSFFERIVRKNPRNFYFTRLFSGEKAFPHEDMYRRTIRFGMDFDKIIRSGAKVFIHTIKAFPKDDSNKNTFRLARLIAETGKAFLEDERDRNKGLYTERTFRVLRNWNMKEVLFTEADFRDPSVIEQIILNSSSIPPIVSFQNHGKEYYLDGGLTNNLLLEAFPPNAKIIGIHYESTTIVGKDPYLLDRCFLVTPSKSLPITSFDYTNAKGVREAYEMGKSDALKKKDQILEYLKKDWVKKAEKLRKN
ncbi:patatin-like phospholipase family protein [Leptospira licerasiae]|uniref:Phospholipase, patatin family n=1 Tax=Leptospira licerasiae str. MMD4847 TaxID=1049971 RepID=A0ABN0HCI1_9LEPT|nr:patatin-like phospholipase family protein [Leptospira licerasiae]EIE02595.1 phospholipase, patatin family [Leptospira licerasiae serovar Varillal str. VAR 010]EJZ43265.1 phospholipase, patatin family [Leptospira licerasiae str. MMD4847]